MTDLITEIFSSFTAVITGLADGIKEAFSHILYADPSASPPNTRRNSTIGENTS